MNRRNLAVGLVCLGLFNVPASAQTEFQFSSVLGSPKWRLALQGKLLNSETANLVPVILANRLRNHSTLIRLEQLSNPAPATKFKSAPEPVWTRRLAEHLTNAHEDRVALRSFFESYVPQFRTDANRLGFPDDLGYALAMTTGIMVAIYQDAEPLEDPILIRLARQLRSALQSPSLLKCSHASKQAFTEHWVSLTVFLASLVSSAHDTKDSKRLEDLRAAAGIVLRSLYRVDPDRIDLRPNETLVLRIRPS